MASSDFVYGLAEFKFAVDGATASLGYIEEDSFDLGGKEGEKTEINAAQVKGSPVLVLPKKNGSIQPSFDLIELKYATLAKVLGGTATASAWNAPAGLIVIQGHAEIITDSGRVIDIPVCSLSAYPTGKLNTTGVAKVHCTLTPVQQTAGASPYSISDYVPAG